MYFPNEVSHLVKVNEMMDQIDEMLSELRMEYGEMAKCYDEALQRIEELESELIFQEEMSNALV